MAKGKKVNSKKVVKQEVVDFDKEVKTNVGLATGAQAMVRALFAAKKDS